MPSNPIQRKSRTAFFLGVLVMLIIAIVIVGVLYVVVFRKDKEASKEEVVAYVYALKQDVRAGSEIDMSMVQEVKVGATAAPTDSIASKTKDSNGNLKNLGFSYGGYKSKIDLKAGTILSTSMMYEGDEIQDSERLVEYNMITLPMDLDIGDYIDVRLMLPNGQDLIVTSKKQVKNIFGSTISLYLTEDEILMMNSAIVEAYIMTASNLHITKYVEPGLQAKPQLTYVPTNEVITLININPNITSEARTVLANRIANGASVRDGINTQTSQYSEDRKNNIESAIQKQIEAAKTARESYLSGLSGY